MKNELASGTKVAHKKNGRQGTILNGFAFVDETWVEWEVETDRGIEVWDFSDFMLA